MDLRRTAATELITLPFDHGPLTSACICFDPVSVHYPSASLLGLKLISNYSDIFDLQRRLMVDAVRLHTTSNVS
jgi:hypothetical protein